MEKFYEEIFLELSNFGELKDLFILDNLSEHLIGNVYAKFCDEKAAANAYDNLQGKYYHSDLVVEEYCPIINPKDGKCYKFEDGLCNKGPYCNFLHFKDISKSLIKSLKDEMYEIHPEYRKNRFSNNNNNNNNYWNKKRIRRHEHTSSESSLDRYDKFTRKRIIHRWNDEYISNKKIEEKRKLMEKLDRHRRHKHKKRHKHYKSDSEKYEERNKYDDKYEILSKKKYEEDIIVKENAQDKITEKSKSKSNSKKMEKNTVDIEEKITNKEESKSREKIENKSKSKEIKIDSDEEETISAGEYERMKNN